MMPGWLWLSIAIMFEVGATTAMKFSDGFSKLTPSALVVIGYGVSFWALSQALRSMPVGVAYAIWAGIGIVLIALIGIFFLHNKADLPGLIGMAMIIGGVVIMNAFSTMAEH